jgi:hypothetical protein
MGWDDRFRRLFITKKDYIVKEAHKGTITFSDNEFYKGETKIELTNTEYFNDVSWTIAYSFVTQGWLSFYSFKPNYYVSLQNYFQTGINAETVEKGIWSHLLTNQSFNVFYGTKYPFIIEVPSKSKYVNKILSSIEYWNETRRYTDVDYTNRTDIGFDRVTIYNNRVNSNLINLVTEIPNNRQQRASYPQFLPNSSNILQTPDDGKWTFNQFYNRIKDNTNNIPVWRNDPNEIDKTINQNAMATIQRGVRERLKGDWFLSRFEYDKDSRFKFICRWWTFTENISV